MKPQFNQNLQQPKNGRLSSIVPFMLAILSLMVTIAPARVGAAMECQITDLPYGGTTQGMTSFEGMKTWKGVTLSTPTLTLTAERDIFGEVELSPMLDVAPYAKNNRIVLGNTESLEVATSDACLGQAVRKSALFNQAMVKSIIKIPANGHMAFMRIPTPPYNGKRQILKVRTILPEIEITPRYKTDIVIGPLQEIWKPGLSIDPPLSQTVATGPSTVESPSLLGSQPALNPFQSALPLPVNESLRMNLTTTQALHGGNCASGCP